jgi:hypothetical protein
MSLAVLRAAAARYGANWRTLLGVALIVALPAAIINGVLWTGGTAGVGTVFIIQVVLGGIVFAACVLVIAVHVETGERPSIRDAFRGVQPHLGRVLVVAALFHFALAIGLLLILPALLAATFWLVVIPLAVVERRWLDAFRRSAQLVRGHAWQMLGVAIAVVLALFALPLGLAAILAGLGVPAAAQAAAGTLITVTVADPIVATVMTIAYFGLREREEPPPEDQPSE